MPQQTNLRRNAGGRVSVRHLSLFFAICFFLALNMMTTFQDGETLQDAWRLLSSSEVKPHLPTTSTTNSTEKNTTDKARDHRRNKDREIAPNSTETTTNDDKDLADHQDPDSGMVHCPTDPLRAPNFDIPRGSLVNIQRATPYLGVLLDAGRHYFPIIWIKRLLDRLQDLQYNLLHFRLTDDQAFNVRLTSHPELAYPSAVNNPGRLVYSVQELKDITAYAKERGIRIMPEINIPGHAGAWAGARPDMVVHCPRYLCSMGYGVPLNVTHVDLPEMLHNIIAEIVEIFDDPPFLHLGGDEVDMGLPCFRQLGIPMFDYAAFEKMLSETVKNVGYPLDQVVRWEITEQEQIERAGRIVHFWLRNPGLRPESQGPYFISTGLYFDTNEEATAFDVYLKTRTFVASGDDWAKPTAIIAGTFELSTEFWYDRNVLGKLIAVAMGASVNSTNKTEQYEYSYASSEHVLNDWKIHCNHVGFGPTLCNNTLGRGTIPFYMDYRSKWEATWKIWRNDTCIRFADYTDGRSIRQNEQARSRSFINGYFMQRNSPIKLFMPRVENSSRSIPDGWDYILGQHSVPNVGVILDVTSSMVMPDRLMVIVTNYIARLGFNLIQLPLVTNKGFVYKSPVQKVEAVHSLLANQDNPSYEMGEHIKPLILTAAALGIAVMPEISVSTDAAGWFNTGYVMNCAHHFCDRGTVVADIKKKEEFSAVVYSVIAELHQTFTSPYLHLGSDERRDALPCIVEDGEGDLGMFSSYESELTNRLEMANISVDKILRWSNAEQIHYPDRTGKITHYRANTTHPAHIQPGNSTSSPGNSTSSPFFATIDITEGDAWSVYQRTRELAALHPEGILAEIRTLTKQEWTTLGIAQRLIAFALGASSSSRLQYRRFHYKYIELCKALGWSVSGDDDKEGCKPPAALESKVIHLTETSEFKKQHCDVLTEPAKVYVKKHVKPFYETAVNDKGKLTH